MAVTRPDLPRERARAVNAAPRREGARRGPGRRGWGRKGARRGGAQRTDLGGEEAVAILEDGEHVRGEHLRRRPPVSASADRWRDTPHLGQLLAMHIARTTNLGQLLAMHIARTTSDICSCTASPAVHKPARSRQRLGQLLREASPAPGRSNDGLILVKRRPDTGQRARSLRGRPRSRGSRSTPRRSRP